MKLKDTFIQGKPKKTKQGNGTHSKPNHGRKKMRGQGSNKSTLSLITTMANRYKFATTLEGFVSVGEDSGKFNNRTFAYTIPHDTLTKVESDREELIKWAKSKATGRVQEAMTPWDDAGVVQVHLRRWRRLPQAQARARVRRHQRRPDLQGSPEVCPQGHQGEHHC